MSIDRKIGLVVLIFCIAMWFFIIPTQTRSAKEATYPRIITVWLGIWGFFLMVKAQRGTSKDVSNKPRNRKGIMQVIASAGTFLACILLMDILGFYIPTFLFLMIALLVLRVREWKVLILMPSISVLMIYLLFEKLLRSPLPKGSIF